MAESSGAWTRGRSDQHVGLSKLKECLISLGIDSEFWRRHTNRLTLEPQPSLDERWLMHAPDESPDQEPERRNKLEKMVKLLALLQEWVQTTAREAADLPDQTSRVERFESELKDLEFGDWGRVARCPLLIKSGDVLAGHSDEEGSLDLYTLAIDDAPTPRSQLEIGSLVAVRGGVEAIPWATPPLPIVPDELPEQPGIGEVEYEVVYADLLEFPAMPASSRLIRLAVEAYGRVYCHYLDVVDEAPAVFFRDWPPQIQRAAENQILVMDGLHVLLAALGREEALIYDDGLLLLNLCYLEWEELTGRWPSKEVEARLRERALYYNGYQRGRSVEVALTQAVEHVRHTVVVSDEESFAANVADAVVQRIGIATLTRAEIEQACNELIGSAWTDLPESSRETLIEGEYLRDLFSQTNHHDYGHVVLQYARAVEGYLRQLGGQGLILSRFRDLLSGTSRPEFLARGAPLNDLATKVTDLVRERNSAAHGDPGSYRTTSRSAMSRVRASVLGSNEAEGILQMLWKHRSDPTGGRQG